MGYSLWGIPYGVFHMGHAPSQIVYVLPQSCVYTAAKKYRLQRIRSQKFNGSNLQHYQKKPCRKADPGGGAPQGNRGNVITLHRALFITILYTYALLYIYIIYIEYSILYVEYVILYATHSILPSKYLINTFLKNLPSNLGYYF